jgi:N-acetylmuramoyl-L-alanine amidase
MPLTILGSGTRDVNSLNDWLKEKGCPEYADLYRQAGEKWGVRWDVAIFQSCLETGFFWTNTTPKDVKPSQNNFAGLGATGGGVAGDSFDSPEIGIEAQIQNLALRCDVAIPKERILSEYARSVYGVIANRHSKYWADLAGTWATDPNYWHKIQSIMADYDDWATTHHSHTSNDMDTITWLELNRADDGSPAITAYAETTPKFTRFYKTMEEFREFLDAFPNVHSGPLVAETDKKIIPRHCPNIDQGVQPPPATGKRILLDPGHSRSKPGARDLTKTVKEELLNEIQATVIKDKLDQKGFEVDIYNPDPDNLTNVGKHAQGYDMFLSLHHNSYGGTGDPYTCAMIDNDKAKPSSKQLAALVAKRVASKIGNPLFGGTHGTPGVYQTGLSVLDAAEQVCEGPCILVESYFLNKYGNMSVATNRSKQAATAIAEAVVEWFS